MSFTKNKPRTLNKLARLMVPVAMASALVTNAGCATLQEMNAESKPYGEQLKERVAQWDEWCKKEKLGPYLEDPKKKRIGTCDFLFLKDKRWDPNADEFSRYAHSIKLPAPHDKPQAQYREGMTSKEYFEELCAKEAGQWIFKKVEGVEGVLQIRPYVKPSSRRDLLIPNTEEPSILDSNTEELWISMGSGGPFSKYQFFEYPLISKNGEQTFLRWYRPSDFERLEPGKKPEQKKYLSLYEVPYVEDAMQRAEYAFVWRGIFRPEFERHGITAGEFLVIHYLTGEVLGFVRLFGVTRPISLSLGNLSRETAGMACANRPKLRSFVDFLQQVLVPIN